MLHSLLACISCNGMLTAVVLPCSPAMALPLFLALPCHDVPGDEVIASVQHPSLFQAFVSAIWQLKFSCHEAASMA